MDCTKKQLIKSTFSPINTRIVNGWFLFPVAVVVAFFICWAPFHVQRLYTIYATFPKPDEKTHSLYLQIYALVTYISGVLYYISATTNPILYSIMSVKFREAFKVGTCFRLINCSWA